MLSVAALDIERLDAPGSYKLTGQMRSEGDNLALNVSEPSHGLLGQLASGGLLALSHGTNDAQKTMGVITLALVAHGDISSSTFHVPTWVVIVTTLL